MNTKLVKSPESVADILQTNVLNGNLARNYGKLKALDTLHFVQEKLFFAAMVEKTEKLKQCLVTAEGLMSLKDAFLQAASIGLSFNPQVAHCYLIPRRARTRKPGEKDEDYAMVPMLAYASPGYRGLTHLAILGGAISWARAEVIHERDVFRYFGPTTKPQFEANIFKSRGARVGVFCHAHSPDGTDFCDVMTAEQVAAVRKKSEAPNSLMWVEFEEEGWKKAVLRRAQKTWPRAVAAPLFQRAMEILNDNGEGINTAGPDGSVIDAVITDDQATTLHAMLTEAGASGEVADATLQKLAKTFGVADIKHLPLKEFDAAKGKLESKIKSSKGDSHGTSGATTQTN